MHQLHSSLPPSQPDGAAARCASQFATPYVTPYVTQSGTLCETQFGIARANLWSRRAKAWKLKS